MTKDQLLKMEIGDTIWVDVENERKACKLDAIHIRKFSVCVDLLDGLAIILINAFVEDVFDLESGLIQWQIERRQQAIVTLNHLLKKTLEEEKALKKGDQNNVS